MNRRDALHLIGAAGLAGWLARSGQAEGELPMRAPRLSTRDYRVPDGVLPDIMVWGLMAEDFAPGAYRGFIHLVEDHSPWKLLTTTIRAPLVEVTDPSVRDHLTEMAGYARRRGMGIAMDLDVRLAREAFRARYPDELQQMLRLRETPLSTDRQRLRIPSADLGDHYTFRTTPYIALSGRLVRVYAYHRDPGGPITGGSVRDITSECTVAAEDAAGVEVELPAGEGRTACCVVAFTHLTPDVFAPHLLSFQQEILESYSGAPFAGACKDEWGFPPCFDGCPEHNDFWYSEHHAAAYAGKPGTATDFGVNGGPQGPRFGTKSVAVPGSPYAERAVGRDLVRDCLLMYAGERGQEAERAAAINHYQMLSWERNGAIEAHFHDTVKAVFGPKAISATHPTWYPYPGVQEIKKNGLDWWIAPRTIAQTDEVTPYCCRTALAKKRGSGLWVNMFYATTIRPYVEEIWRGALGGGRVNFHPLYPVEDVLVRYRDLLRGDLMRAACRVRLLNFIASAPRHCPVAVVFGHAAAMSWAEGGNWGDTGVGLANALDTQGFPADLIPLTEALNGSLRVGDDGAVMYGAQRYPVLIIHRPEFEPPEFARWLRRALRGGRTRVFAVGSWTRDREGTELDPWAELPGIVRLATVEEAASAAVAALREMHEPEQSPADRVTLWGFDLAVPPMSGHARLTDGTFVLVRAAADVAGDPIDERLEVDGCEVEVAATGLVAVRIGPSGRVTALAAGALRRFVGGGLSIGLDEPADIALWHDADGRLRGIVQDLPGPLPESLARLGATWTHLRVPPPLPEI